MLTADTITDEQISGLRRSLQGDVHRLDGAAWRTNRANKIQCDIALGYRLFATPDKRRAARARLAELNTRASSAKEK